VKIISRFQRSLDYKTYLLELFTHEMQVSQPKPTTTQTPSGQQTNLSPSSAKWKQSLWRRSIVKNKFACVDVLLNEIRSFWTSGIASSGLIFWLCLTEYENATSGQVPPFYEIQTDLMQHKTKRTIHEVSKVKSIWSLKKKILADKFSKE
jgi:hypothetical protein